MTRPCFLQTPKAILGASTSTCSTLEGIQLTLRKVVSSQSDENQFASTIIAQTCQVFNKVYFSQVVNVTMCWESGFPEHH